jgi:hypothetical protein
MSGSSPSLSSCNSVALGMLLNIPVLLFAHFLEKDNFKNLLHRTVVDCLR